MVPGQDADVARNEHVERNKQAVIRLYEVFGRGDVDALDPLVAEDYVQHNPQAGDGRAALAQFLTAMGPLDVVVHRMLGEGDLVAAHCHVRNWDMAAMDVFRFDREGRIVEHWDVLQPVAATTVSGNDMFSQLG